MLGLLTSEKLEGHWSLTARRKIFHQYPNGKAPLTGLLSLTSNNKMSDEDMASDKPEFGWHEDRGDTFEYETAAANAAGPFTDTDGANGAAGTDKTTGGWNLAIGDIFRVQLEPFQTIQPKDVLQIADVPVAGATTTFIQGIVSAVYEDTGCIDVEVTEAYLDLLNTGGSNGLKLVTVGSANAEGSNSGQGFMTYPIDPSNYTQIFKNPFGFSRTALKAGMKWDKTGAYKEAAKKNSIKHMVSLEYANFFSQRSKTTVIEDGESKTRRTMGGIMWYLQQYEKGSEANGGKFDYRPNGDDVSAGDWKTEENKRIINVNGTCTKKEMNMLLERAFRYTNEETFEKLILCGGGLLSVLNEFVDGESVKQTELNSKEDKYGMNVTSWVTPHGTLHFKDHPLMTQTSMYRNSGFILDVGNLKYTPLQDSDTDLLKNQQPRGHDGRKDVWLTEAGLEVWYPESHMFISNLTGIE